jgi:hypothetical protein
MDVIPQSVWWTTNTVPTPPNTVSSARRERISSLVRPPALRIIPASAKSGPRNWSGWIRGSPHVTGSTLSVMCQKSVRVYLLTTVIFLSRLLLYSRICDRCGGAELSGKGLGVLLLEYSKVGLVISYVLWERSLATFSFWAPSTDIIAFRDSGIFYFSCVCFSLLEVCILSRRYRLSMVWNCCFLLKSEQVRVYIPAL